jgi:hypothetical protein
LDRALRRLVQQPPSAVFAFRYLALTLLLGAAAIIGVGGVFAAKYALDGRSSR